MGKGMDRCGYRYSPRYLGLPVPFTNYCRETSKFTGLSIHVVWICMHHYGEVYSVCYKGSSGYMDPITYEGTHCGWLDYLQAIQALKIPGFQDGWTVFQMVDFLVFPGVTLVPNCKAISYFIYQNHNQQLNQKQVIIVVGRGTLYIHIYYIFKIIILYK
jgi:hypothetical protein